MWTEVASVLPFNIDLAALLETPLITILQARALLAKYNGINEHVCYSDSLHRVNLNKYVPKINIVFMLC
jgi:hypothetical protein